MRGRTSFSPLYLSGFIQNHLRNIAYKYVGLLFDIDKVVIFMNFIDSVSIN